MEQAEQTLEVIPQEEQKQQPTIEDIAKEQGWNPDHEGPEKIDAAEFVRRKPLFDKIKAQSKELKEIKRSVDSMASTYKQMSDAQYKRGILDAEKRMATAKDSLDVDAYNAAANDKAVFEQGLAANPEPVPQDVVDFCERNPWFDENKVMQVDAIEYRNKYRKLNPQAPLSEVLEYVEARIKKDYPEAFEPKSTTKKPNAPPVEGGGGGNMSSDPLAKLKNSMTADERKVMKMFTANGKMTEKEYLESYSAVRDI